MTWPAAAVSAPKRLVPEEWAAFPPGAEVFGWVGRGAKRGAAAPGAGPAAWTRVRVTEWLFPDEPTGGQLVAEGVAAIVVGAREGLWLRFEDVKFLREGSV